MKPILRTSLALAACALLVGTAQSQAVIARHAFSGNSSADSDANTKSNATNLTAGSGLGIGRLEDWLANHQ